MTVSHCVEVANGLTHYVNEKLYLVSKLFKLIAALNGEFKTYPERLLMEKSSACVVDVLIVLSLNASQHLPPNIPSRMSRKATRLDFCEANKNKNIKRKQTSPWRERIKF